MFYSPLVSLDFYEISSSQFLNISHFLSSIRPEVEQHPFGFLFSNDHS